MVCTGGWEDSSITNGIHGTSSTTFLLEACRSREQPLRYSKGYGIHSRLTRVFGKAVNNIMVILKFGA